MAKRGYKLQEFVAHSGSVNCLEIGKKTCRLFVTGGDDQKVNLWSIGNPTSLVSLCGHATPVESVTINSAEVLVLAGASAGVIKLWDLEETKMVRTLPGHRSYCSAVEFHPFGEFFASGSMDTNLKIWDIRKKGCIHTYKGHTRGISNIKFTPDGRWVVSGGLDNVVKIWDLTAGKLLHDFKSHEGHIRSIDFHPLEFLLATGSADKTVKLWDLETFELIGSTKPEASGVRSITFHPDGRTLFCGLDDSLKVVSWEPVVCHDSVDMGWSTLGDLSIHDGKLLGCSYYHNSVAVWAADISLIKPYGTCIVPDEISHPEEKHDLQEGQLVKQGSHRRATSSLRCPSPDYDIKEIKNIYVDTAGGKPVNSKRVGSPTVVTPSESNEIKSVPSQKKVSTVGVQAKETGRTKAKSFIVPALVLRDSPDSNDSAHSKRESITSARATNVMSENPSPVRRQSAVNFDKERLLVPDVSEPISKERYVTMVDNCNEKLVAENNSRENSEAKHLNIEVVAPKLEEIVSPKTPSSQENSNGLVNSSVETNSVKFVNGVAVVRGRTRSLVERFERREMPSGDEAQAPQATSPVNTMPEIPEAVPIVREEREIGGINRDETARIGTNSDETTTINIDRDETTTIHACPPEDVASERAEVLQVTSPNSSITVNRSKRVGGINRNETTTVGTNRNETTTIGINRDETTTINACSTKDLASDRAEVRQVTGSNSSINVRSRRVAGINRDETTRIGTNRDDRTTIGINRDETTTINACSPKDLASDRAEVRQVTGSNSSINVRSRRVGSINRDETTRIGTNRDGTSTIGINRDETTTIHTCPPHDLASERADVLQVVGSNSSSNVNRSRRVGNINRDETTRIRTNRVEARTIGLIRDGTTTIHACPPKDLASERVELRQVMGSNSSINVNRSRRVVGINRNETTRNGNNRDETRIIGIDRDGTTTSHASPAKDLASERAEVLQVTGSNSSINVNRSRRVGGINRDENTRVGTNRDETTTTGINRDETTTIHASPQNDLASEIAEDRHSPMDESHSTSASDGSLLEDLMRNHDVFLSTIRSRLTKLQVVRHFWARNDIKGAIEAVRKLPDHSVQAEVISLLIEKMDILTLDLFSCLLPMLLGLLGSKMERHASISLEMLLKLVAVFGPVVRSTISAAPSVGVDLHKEQRIQCCNQCFIQLQKIQRVLPVLIRRGGLLAKCAMELNLVLQD